MAKNDELSFIDLVDESKSVSSIQDEKDQRLTAAEENIDNIAEIVNENSKVTNRLAAKIDRISKTLSKPRIKKLFENATPLNKMVDKQKQESKGKQVNDKATKVGNLEGQDGMLEILNKILQFMQKTYDEDKLLILLYTLFTVIISELVSDLFPKTRSVRIAILNVCLSDT